MYTLIGIITIFGIGLCMQSLFKFNSGRSFFFRLGLSYGIGIFAICLQLILYSLIQIRWTPQTILIPWDIFILIVISTRTISLPTRIALPVTKNPIDLVLLFVLISLNMFTLFEATVRPLISWDGWANWIIGGKAFYIANGIDPTYIHYVNNSNPPLMNLVASLGFILQESAQFDIVPRILYSIFYIAILFTFFGFLKAKTTRTRALFFTLLLASTQNLIRHGGRFDVGDADLQLGYFFFVSVISFFEYTKTKIVKTLFFAQLFLAAGAMVKSEGMTFFLVMQVLIGIFLMQRKMFVNVLFSSIGLIFIGIWYYIKIHFHLPENPFLTSIFNLQRIPIIFLLFVKEFIYIARWNFLWILFFLILPFVYKKYIWIVLPIILQLCVYLFIYITSPISPSLHIPSSFDRLLLHLAPLAMLSIASMFFVEKRVK